MTKRRRYHHPPEQGPGVGDGHGSSLDGSGGGDVIGCDLYPYNSRPPFEPVDRIPDFDAMRQHYVAFSRAQNLLVLTAGRPPERRFGAIWDRLPHWPRLDAAALVKLLTQRFASEQTVAAPRQPADLVIPRVKRLVVRPQGRNLMAS